MDGIITAKELSIVYRNGKGQNCVIEKLSFSVPQGSVFGIVGASGVGKTSLLRAIVCEHNSNLDVKGALFYKTDVYYSNGVVMASVLKQFFFVPQFTGLAISPLHTVGDVFFDLYSVRKPKPVKKVIMDCFVRELEELGLFSDIIKCYPHELSGGMLQRVLLAMAFAIVPPVLILDEPTSALDWDSQLLVVERIKSVQNKHGTTLIIVSHDNLFLENICTYFLSLEEAGGER